MSIPVFKPSIKRRDMHSVLSCLVTDIIGPADVSESLVKTITEDLGFQSGLALREYGRAIELVFNALNIKAGDKVLISPLNPGVYGRALRVFGVEPVFIDVREADGCIDAVGNLDKDNVNVKAVFVHAPLGRIPPMEQLYSLGVPVVVDLGEAIGARESEGLLGHQAHYLILPMEPEAIATTGGGTVLLARSKKEFNTLELAFQTLGTDSALPDLNASLGLVQWRDYPKALESRDALHGIYMQALSKGRHRTLSEPDDEQSRAVPYSFPVVISGNIGEVRRYARKKGVETRMAFNERLLDEYADQGDRYPKAKKLMMSTLLFPLYPSLSKKDAQLIVKVLSTLP